MDPEEKHILEFFETLGLSSEEANLYLTLVKYGESTTLELSRLTKITRTRVYRLLEEMKSKGVIEEIIDKYTTRARAVSTERLGYLVKGYVDQAEKLSSEFISIKALLSGFVGANHQETKILFYRGQEGLQQLAWNALRAKDELRGYTYRLWETAIGESFARKWYSEARKRGFTMRDIYSDEYLKSAKGITSMSSLPEFKDFDCESRYVPSEKLNIDHQVDIYNDVVAYYNWYKGEVFGAEIYNAKVAKLQKQIFDIVWNISTDTTVKP